MRNHRIIFILIMMLLIVIGVSGCMKSGKSAKEEMLEFMKNKYNEEFEFVSIGNEAWNANYTEMIVHSEKFPKGRIIVRKYGDKIVDNYTDFLMKEKIEEELRPIIAQVYPESNVFYRPGGMPMGDEVNQSMSIKEYSKAMIIPLSFAICISDPSYKINKDEKVEELRKVLESKEYICMLYIFYVKEDKLDLINDMNINDLFTDSKISDWILCEGRFRMDRTYQFKTSR